MSASSSTNPAIVVIGAGIIGLTSALKLQQLLPSTPILIVAKEWPTSIPGSPTSHSADYASMWAGAHVRPIPASTPQLRREAAWLKRTVAELERHRVSEPWVGIRRLPGVEYLDDPPAEYLALDATTFEAESGLPGFRRYEGGELPDGVKLGFEYETYCINSPLYSGHLLRKFILQGGQIELTNLTIADKTITKQNKDGSWSFIIPRSFNGGTVIGGTKEPGEWSLEPSAHLRQRLLDNAQPILAQACSEPPVPGALKVFKDVIGRRPAREGGMRVETETKDDGDGVKHVIHAYGAGGRGYEMSWGVASEVADLAREVLRLEVKSRL
ncbi:hypothetical protein ACJ41O_006509 [Fusarium nematophilum]